MEERNTRDEAVRELPKRVEDLLTEDQRGELRRDLARLAKIRKKAMDTAADWPMP